MSVPPNDNSHTHNPGKKIVKNLPDDSPWGNLTPDTLTRLTRNATASPVAGGPPSGTRDQAQLETTRTVSRADVERMKAGNAKPVKSVNPNGFGFEPDGEIISHPLFTRKFQRGFHLINGQRVIVKGQPQRCIIALSPNKDNPKELGKSFIWLGDIKVIGVSLAFKVAPSRRLEIPQWSEFVTVEITNEQGHVRVVDVASMDLRQMIGRAVWPDRLGVTSTGRISFIKEFIQLMSRQESTRIIIRGQGPMYLDDQSPNNSILGDKTHVFVSKSVVYDRFGNVRDDIHPEISMPDGRDYYDLTPVKGISDASIKRGIELFRASYGECTPAFSALPGAMNGQLFTGFITAIDVRFFSAIGLFGKKGSGKSRFGARYDAIQGNDPIKTRSGLSAVKPAVNLGDNTGTAKGVKYNITGFGGYSVTTDDVVKSGESETQIRIQSDKVRNMISSMESGGAALGKVDYANQEVVASQSPALNSSIRVFSELPIMIDSTLDRMIILPFLPSAFGKGDVFRQDVPPGFSDCISAALGTAENLELMHLAYSAYVPWAFAQWHTLLESCYEKAKAITETWGITNSRIPERYATIVAGNLMFAEFASHYDIDLDAELAIAFAALKDCAVAQAGNTVPEFVEFGTRLRALLMRNKVSIPGPPQWNDDGSLATSWSVPGRVIENENPDKTATRQYEYPDGISPDQLGLILAGSTYEPPKYGNQFIAGYLIPPKEKTKGGRPRESNSLTDDWHIAFKHDKFAELIAMISREGRAFDPKAVMDSARQMNAGDITRVYIGNASKPNRYWILSAQILNPSGPFIADESEKEGTE